MYQVALTAVSSNRKTGPIPVSSTTAATCPKACPFNSGNGCYAAGGPQAIHWRKITDGTRGDDWHTFCGRIAALPDGQLWRHNVAGDLPGDGYQIDEPALQELCHANVGRRGFSYTHYDPTIGDNADVIRTAILDGFTINLSGNNPAHADTLADMRIAPVVTVLPSDAPRISYTPTGRRIVTCPAVTRDNVSCASCKLCARSDRDIIIGFPAHGSSRRKADTIARNES